MENHFDKAAKDWDKNKMHAERSEVIAKDLIKEIDIKKGLAALEFGSGTGLLSFALADHFERITLMDSSSEMTRMAMEKIARNGIYNLQAVFFNLEIEEYIDKKFDFIFTQMALHHVGNIEKIIHKFYKLLNPGGKLAIADLYKEDGTFHDSDFTGHTGFDTDRLEKIIKETGFTEINIKPCFVMRKVDSAGKEKEFPLFLMIAKR
jgi:tRNA (cmo5U34)-methyltransferase